MTETDERNRRMAMAFFCLIGCTPEDAEDIIRKSVEKNDLDITRDDVAWVRHHLFAHPEWLGAELELYRILGI